MDKGLVEIRSEARLGVADCACEGVDGPGQESISQLSDAQASGLADIFKALGDPTRVKIIHYLLPKERCVHEISSHIGMEQSAVSHQLRYLRNVHIVKRRKEGKTVFYALDDEHIEQIFVQTMGHLGHRTPL
ncbi:ArsR/SmtB family transcription factor [Paenibacillus roseipurpureus]|uniref:Metalloregulator ArsR/SmtB family transcription factor n=1 Tax=Paenibacillus roseopurpureus TaxID=2918901 RepID=A0AA96RJP1_9BACL|nr:metalloregulator ArsR/SmtB family transcription factor [Paenibacillus sp. MBLB1832]WNR43371.1 metalloregulator ArsR/SmtB family transcription factor [Paenibacillus sp. MBLB1832]